MTKCTLACISPAEAPNLSGTIIRLAIITLATLVTACATQKDLTLEVNSRHVEGVQYLPQELTRMMTDLGYQHLRVKDPVTEQSVAVKEQYGQYRMLYQSLEDSNIRVDIHIVKADGRIGLHFYDIHSNSPSSTSIRLYEQLRQRLNHEFGAENVSDNHTVLSP